MSWHCQNCGGFLDLEQNCKLGNIYQCGGCGARFQHKIAPPGSETLTPLLRDPAESKLSTPDDPGFKRMLDSIRTGRL